MTRQRRIRPRDRGEGLGALALAVGAVLSCPAGAHAQATGTISGVVTDDSGAVLPGVAVVATSQATNQVRSATTGTDGFYTVPLLPPGVYNVGATPRRLRPPDARRRARERVRDRARGPEPEGGPGRGDASWCRRTRR